MKLFEKEPIRIKRTCKNCKYSFHEINPRLVKLHWKLSIDFFCRKYKRIKKAPEIKFDINNGCVKIKHDDSICKHYKFQKLEI